MAMSTQQEERDHFTVSGFCEAILSTAEFECSLEDILDKKASEAKRLIWKMELKRENKEEQKSEKDEDITEIMNKEEKKPEMGVDISTEQRREMIITRPIHVQRIGENPLKNAVGHINKDPVQNSVLKVKGSINDKETKKDERKMKRELMKEEKIRQKKAKEEEKIVKTQFKAIEKSNQRHNKDVKSKWKKEQKRRKQMKKMGEKANRMLEKEMKKIEKKREKDEKKKVFQAFDVVQDKQNDLTVKTNEDDKNKTIDIDGEQQNCSKIVKANEETENDEDERKTTDQTIDVEKNRTEKDTEVTEEQTISCDSIGNNEVKENSEKDAKDIKMSTKNAGKKTTFAARISGFFRSLSCIKKQKKNKDVC
ncbi:DNA ligase 1-like [Mytilus edulis]|uniref:DNA ligase 1-like n=1 Tax=Mytilus edulis TaxID=6550 RepID=UPI0039EF5AE4